jgi:hypothetical protein
MYKAEGEYQDMSMPSKDYLNSSKGPYGNITPRYQWDYGNYEGPQTNSWQGNKGSQSVCYKRFVTRWLKGHPAASLKHNINPDIDPPQHHIVIYYASTRFFGQSRNEQHAFFLVWQQIMNFY